MTRKGKLGIGLDELLAGFGNLSPTPSLGGQTVGRAFVRDRLITDSDEVQAVLRLGSYFSLFQEFSLYHSAGFFETRVDFATTSPEEGAMPLLPRTLSPFFGKVIGELLFGCYVSLGFPLHEPPVFTGIGAGGGYLDYDIIRYFTALTFTDDRFPRHATVLRDRAEFIVSDRTDTSLDLLKRNLSDLVSDPRLSSRVHIEKNDALRWSLPRRPFGIVYANELIDNLPTEPVVTHNGMLYSVRLLIYDPTASLSINSDGKEKQFDTEIALLQRRFSLTGRILPLEIAYDALLGEDSAARDMLRFFPVLIPAHAESRLVPYLENVPSIKRNINRPEFGGIYPIHVGTDKLFCRLREAYDHGIVLLVDYVSSNGGNHNWNIAVNQFPNYSFGKGDIDFQMDPEQVVERAAARGMRLLHRERLSNYLKMMSPYAAALTRADLERHFRLNTPSEMHGQLPRMSTDTLHDNFMLQSTLMISALASKYEILCFGF